MLPRAAEHRFERPRAKATASRIGRHAIYKSERMPRNRRSSSARPSSALPVEVFQVVAGFSIFASSDARLTAFAGGS